MSSNITLRPYQNDLANKIRLEFFRGKKKVLAVAPTGAGKTIMFSYIAKNAMIKGLNVLILAHREELVQQISETLSLFDCDHGFVVAGREMHVSKKLQVGSVFTVVNRIGDLYPPDLIILDEAHHFSSGNTWSKILDSFLTAKIIGVTATACRLDGKPLGDIFDSMVMGPSVSELIELGSLSDYRAFAPALIDPIKMKISMGDYSIKESQSMMDTPTITGNAVKEWLKIAKNKKTIVFCTSVSHAKNVAQEFISNGIPADSLDGTVNKDKRKSTLDAFKDGRLTVLTNVGLFTEGFDCKTIDCVQLLRPTASLSLYLQMVGRGLRVYEGKEKALIVDHVRAIEKHGLPDQDREWSLSERIKPRKGPAENPIKICPSCFAAVPISITECPECDYLFEEESKGREIKTDELGTLHEIDKNKLKISKKVEQKEAKTLEDLIALGRRRNYRYPVQWAERIFSYRRGK